MNFLSCFGSLGWSVASLCLFSGCAAEFAFSECVAEFTLLAVRWSAASLRLLTDCGGSLLH